MILDQSKKSPFFDLIDNEIDDRLCYFTSTCEVDTNEVKKVANEKIIQLQKVIKICEDLEQQNATN